MRWSFPRSLRLPRLPRLRWPRRTSPRGPRRRHRRAGLVGLVVLAVIWWLSGNGDRQRWPRPQILDAIRFVESSHRENVPDGDGGLAIGPYQIHSIYWQDAVKFEPALGGDYEQCRQRAYAERVIDAYMRKWAAAAWANGDAEVIARVHNGGPKGVENPKTDGYWQRVRARLP